MTKRKTTIGKGRFDTYEAARKYVPFGKNVGVRERHLKSGKTIYMALIEITVTDEINLPSSEIGI